MLRRLMMAGGGGSPVTWNDHVLALPNLWGWWKLDETAGAAVTATDSSGNARHGTYNAAGTQAAGLFSGSATHQATLGARVDVPNWSAPTSAKFTVAAVIKTTHASVGFEQQIFSADGGVGGRIFQFYKNASTHVLSATLIYPSVVVLHGTTAINDGNPHLAIFVYDESLAAADGRMKLYLDGALHAQSTTAITLSAGTADLAIGSRRGGSDTGLWAGAIDEAFFCNGAISSTDVAALWAARNLSSVTYRSRLQFAGADASTTFTDDTGKVWTAGGNAQIDTSLGDQRALFDGTGDYITTPHHADLVFSGDFKINFTMRFNNKAGYQTVVAKGYTPQAASSWLVQTGNGDGKLNFYYLSAGSGGVNLVAVDAGSTVNNNQDYAIEISRVGSTVTIKRDGVVVGTGTSSFSYVSVSDLVIGGGSNTGFNNYWFNGWIKDFRIT